VAERDAALHAAGALLPELGNGKESDELAVVADALARLALVRLAPVEAEEAAKLAHD
jgi:hypothetical protein